METNLGHAHQNGVKNRLKKRRVVLDGGMHQLRNPVSFRSLMLLMAHSSVSHRDRECLGRGAAHVGFDLLPDVEDLAAAEGANVVNPFEQDAVLQPFADRPGVVLDASRKLVGGEVSL
jgi:hypothetical protein